LVDLINYKLIIRRSIPTFGKEMIVNER